MALKEITEGFAVSPQIDSEEVDQIAARGFRTILCNRPDDEAEGQPPFSAIAAAAQAAGIEARYIPVVPGAMTEADIEAFAAALRDLPGPVLAYCRSGARSEALWSQHAAGAA